MYSSDKRPESVFSRRVKAGSKRTYFFDVRPNRKGDYFLAITESRKVLGEEDRYEKNKIFLYKEDFNKFLRALEESIGHVKTELMPDFDFTTFDREREYQHPEGSAPEGGEKPAPRVERKDTFSADDTAHRFDENDKL